MTKNDLDPNCRKVELSRARQFQEKEFCFVPSELKVPVLDWQVIHKSLDKKLKV